MRDFAVREKDEGKRVDRFVQEARTDLSRVFILKAIRQKKIKRNGKRTEAGERLSAGDVVSVYLAETEAPARTDGFSVIYEDARILAVYKKPRLACEDRTGVMKDTLASEVNAYLSEKGESAALCHRIDFNTEGLVLLAKDRGSLEFLTEAIKRREIGKRYLCVCRGRPAPESGELVCQLFKDAKKNRVYLSDEPVKGSKTAVTRYRTLSSRAGLSLVECELVTGRTHQIRAQLARAGWPILGDEKYGDKEMNKKYKEKRQLLCAYRLELTFPAEGPLADLSGKVITAGRVDFKNRYFS